MSCAVKGYQSYCTEIGDRRSYSNDLIHKHRLNPIFVEPGLISRCTQLWLSDESQGILDSRQQQQEKPVSIT